MEYDTIAHVIKIGGTLFFSGFFFLVMAYLFWPKNAKTPMRALMAIIAAFAGLGFLIALAIQLGGVATVILGIALLLAFIAALYGFRSTNDRRYSEAAHIPFHDETIIRDASNE